MQTATSAERGHGCNLSKSCSEQLLEDTQVMSSVESNKRMYIVKSMHRGGKQTVYFDHIPWFLYLDLIESFDRLLHYRSSAVHSAR